MSESSPTEVLSADPVPLMEVFAVESDLLTCPECGMTYHGNTGLGVHRAAKHGYRPVRSKKKKLVKPKRLPTVDVAPSEPDWTADEIFTSVVSMLYPSGTVDIRALPVLIQWRSDTERMLKGLP